MDVKEEEDDYPNVLIPVDDPLQLKQEGKDFAVDGVIKEEPLDGLIPSVARENNEFGCSNLTEGEESRVKMEEEESRNIESPEEEELPAWSAQNHLNVKSLDAKQIQTIRDLIATITDKCRPWRWYVAEGKERLQAALFSVCTGELRSTDAIDKFDLSARTFNAYWRETKDKLKTIGIFEKLTQQESATPVEEIVTIEGISVPISISVLTEWITSGRIDFSRAQPFLGTRNELKEKFIIILHSMNFRGVLLKLVDGIMSVYVDGKTISKACRIHKFNQKTLSEYATAVKIFIDFARSPCSWEYRSRGTSMVPQALPLTNGSTESLQPLPRLPEKRIIEEWEVKKEEIDDEYGLIKEEHIEPPVKKIKEE